MEKKGISQEILKLIACITMLADHIGAVLWPCAELRIIGRLSFPIYCFLLAEGIHHTRNPREYFLRLATAMLISEVPYDLLFYGRITWVHQSVMVTLLLGLLYGILQKRIDTFGYKIVMVLPFLFLAELLGSDYGGWGVAMVAFFLLTREVPARGLYQIIGLGLISWMIGGATISVGTIRIPIQVFGVLALIPIEMYSGRKTTENIWIRRGFYLFYPVHLLVLLLINVL